MSCRTGVRVGPDLRRAAARRALAAFVICAGVLMTLMRRAGTVMLVGGARPRRASGSAAGAQANAIYQKREYCDQ